MLTETTSSTADQPAQPDLDAMAAEEPTGHIQPDLLVTFDPAVETVQAEPEAAASAGSPAEIAAAVEPEPVASPAEAAEIVVDATAPVRAVFADLGLSDPILRAIAEMGYLHPTPIQEQAIPIVLMGRDVLGVAQTGTGKTAGFTLPMLDILAGSRARARMPRSLILEPTRELALQVAENFVQYGKHTKLTHALLIGGESMSEQKDALMRGVDVLIATPGRLIDLFERGGLLMTDTRILVIDEADRMLDMGFIPDVERIVAMLPRTRQTLFFSATMAPEIKRLSDAFLQNPKVITVSRAASVAPTIVAGLALVEESDKRDALRRLIVSENVQNALIFCNRKIEVDRADQVAEAAPVQRRRAAWRHVAAGPRTATLARFKANELRLLVCSDVAARGIDIGGLSHVFNFDVPHHAEDYVHRIGRTGRAGLTGHAFTLATPEDRLAVEAIEHLVGAAIPRIAVEGLETASWAAGDGKKRRGRGARLAPAAAPKPEAKPRSRRAAAPKEAAPELPMLETLPDTAPEPVPEKAPEPRRARTKRSEPRPEPRPEPAAPVFAARERPRREGRYRDEDLGPAVQGFGDDVPAFMMIRLRTRADAPRPSEDIDA